jgi:hypothetical protein
LACETGRLPAGGALSSRSTVRWWIRLRTEARPARSGLYAFAVATTTRLLQLGLGPGGTIVASLLFIFLNIPTTGGSVAPQHCSGLRPSQ